MNRLKELRKSRNLLQKDIANILKISNSAYSYWETGRFEPDSESLAMLADYYNVSIDYLLGRTDSPTPPYPSGGIEDVRTELKRLGIDGNDEELHYLLKKIGSLTPEQKQLIITMINNFKD